MKFAVFVLGAIPVWSATSFPITFIPNVGQVNSQVRYVVETPDVRGAFMDDGMLLETKGASVRVLFRGSNENVQPEGRGSLDARVSFFRGAPAMWRTGLRTFAGIAYPNLYPGIDATYGSAGPLLKSEFRVAPGADPRAIRLAYEGADAIRVERDGSLYVRVGS